MIDRNELARLAGNIERHSFRKGSVSAFTLTAFPVEPHEELTLHVTRECEGLVYGNAEVGSFAALEACIEALDGRVDYIIYDIGLFNSVVHPERMRSRPGLKSVLLPYDDLGVWVASVRLTLLALVPDLILRKTAVVATGKSEDRLASRLLMELAWLCKDLWVFNNEEPGGSNTGGRDKALEKADVVIGAAIYRQVITTDHLVRTGQKPLVIDAGIGTISLEAAEYARAQGMKLIRVDNRAAMAGTILSIIQSHDLVSRVMGESSINGVPVVAGGIVGRPGSIIVDSIDNPSQVIGIADGTGRVRYRPMNDEEQKRLDRVNRALQTGE